MSFQVLTPYLLFFITQEDFLFAVMKDYRLFKVKKTAYFSALSTDYKILTGISFDGEKTHIFSQNAGLCQENPKQLASFFGYFYYPCLSASRKKLAIIRADLFKKKAQGELVLYSKNTRKWKQEKIFDAKIKPPYLLQNESVIFINALSELILYETNSLKTCLAQNVNCFCVSTNQENLVYATNNNLILYSLKEKSKKEEIFCPQITALSLNEEKLFYATEKNNKYAIYEYNLRNKKTELITTTQEKVILINGQYEL